MRSFRSKPVGWRGESYRHYLAAKGIKTKRYFAEGDIAMRKFKDAGLRRVSSGRDRIVFVPADEKRRTVVKVAKNPQGLQQNDQEGDYIAPVPGLIDSGEDYVEVEMADEPASKETKRMLKDIQETMIDPRMMYPRSEEEAKRIQKRISKHNEKLAKYGLEDLGNYNVAWGDMTRPSTWGELRGQPVIVDAGALNKDSIGVYDRVGKRHTLQMSKNDWEKIKAERRKAKKEGIEKLYAKKDITWRDEVEVPMIDYPDSFGYAYEKKVVMMSPDEFLKKAGGKTYDDHLKKIEGVFEKDKSFASPFLEMNDSGEIVKHDGRHRVLYAKRQGVKEVPVVMFKYKGKMK